MAGEITISLSVVGSNAGAVASATDSDVIVMTGSNMSSQTVTILSTASTTIAIGAVTIGGVMVIKNLSTSGTIYVDNAVYATLALAVAGSPVKIKYGETALIRTNALTYTAWADISALVQVVCFDN
jgi:hypothetical protein